MNVSEPQRTSSPVAVSQSDLPKATTALWLAGGCAILFVIQIIAMGTLMRADPAGWRVNTLSWLGLSVYPLQFLLVFGTIASGIRTLRRGQLQERERAKASMIVAVFATLLSLTIASNLMVEIQKATQRDRNPTSTEESLP